MIEGAVLTDQQDDVLDRGAGIAAAIGALAWAMDGNDTAGQAGLVFGCGCRHVLTERGILVRWCGALGADDTGDGSGQQAEQQWLVVLAMNR